MDGSVFLQMNDDDVCFINKKTLFVHFSINIALKDIPVKKMEFFNSLYWDIENMLKTPSNKDIYYLKTNNIHCDPAKFFDVDPDVKAFIDDSELSIPLPKHLWDLPIKKSQKDIIQLAGPDQYTTRTIDKCIVDVPNQHCIYTINFKGDTFGDMIFSIHNFLLSKNLPNKKLDKFYLDSLINNFEDNVRENKIMYGLKNTPNEIFSQISEMLRNKFNDGNLLMYQLLLPPFHRLRGVNKFFYDSGKWITRLTYEY